MTEERYLDHRSMNKNLPHVVFCRTKKIEAEKKQEKNNVSYVLF